MSRGRESARPKSDFWGELKRSQPMAFLLGSLAVARTMLGLDSKKKNK